QSYVFNLPHGMDINADKSLILSERADITDDKVTVDLRKLARVFQPGEQICLMETGGLSTSEKITSKVLYNIPTGTPLLLLPSFDVVTDKSGKNLIVKVVNGERIDADGEQYWSGSEINDASLEGVGVYVVGGTNYDENDRFPGEFAIKNWELEIKNGNFAKSAYGGFSGGTGAATGNELTIEGGTFSEDVFGGYSREGSASGNTVAISGGAFGTPDAPMTIFGGYGAVAAQNNTVRISATNGVAPDLRNAYLSGGNLSDSTGNVLEINGKGVQAMSVANFQRYVFNLPSDTVIGADKALILSKTADITGARVSVDLTSLSHEFVVGEEICLMETGGLSTSEKIASKVAYNAPVGVSLLLLPSFDVVKDNSGRNLIVKVSKGERFDADGAR
ncbi:MAG: hypothetical protein HUJ65_01785, partial [Oscillospiraceae bacterium]|nr:hypothetical protein [Oscillospiraceae bacterium]